MTNMNLTIGEIDEYLCKIRKLISSKKDFSSYKNREEIKEYYNKLDDFIQNLLWEYCDHNRLLDQWIYFEKYISKWDFKRDKSKEFRDFLQILLKRHSECKDQKKYLFLKKEKTKFSFGNISKIVTLLSIVVAFVWRNIEKIAAFWDIIEKMDK